MPHMDNAGPSLKLLRDALNSLDHSGPKGFEGLLGTGLLPNAPSFGDRVLALLDCSPAPPTFQFRSQSDKPPPRVGRHSDKTSGSKPVPRCACFAVFRRPIYFPFLVANTRLAA